MKVLPEVDQNMIFTVEDCHQQNHTAVSINSNCLVFILGCYYLVSLHLLKTRSTVKRIRSKAFSQNSWYDFISASSSAVTQSPECLLWSGEAALQDLRAQWVLGSGAGWDQELGLSACPWAWQWLRAFSTCESPATNWAVAVILLSEVFRKTLLSYSVACRDSWARGRAEGVDTWALVICLGEPPSFWWEFSTLVV